MFKEELFCLPLTSFYLKLSADSAEMINDKSHYFYKTVPFGSVRALTTTSHQKLTYFI